MALVCAGPEEVFELLPVGQGADDLDLVHAGLLLDLAAERPLEVLVSVDAPGRNLRRHLGHALVVEDEELATPRDIADDPLAYQRADEVASPAPELEVGADRHPAKRAAVVLPRLRKPLRGSHLDVVAGGIVRHAELADEEHVDARFLLDLADGRLGDGLTFLDPASGHVRCVLR